MPHDLEHPPSKFPPLLRRTALFTLLFLCPLGCKGSRANGDDAPPAAVVDSSLPSVEVGHSGYRARDFGYNYSQLPTATGFVRFAAPRIEDQSPTTFVLFGPGAAHKVVIDGRARVWRATSPNSIECVGSIDASQFQRMLELREPAAAGELVITDGPCKDCGAVVAKMYLATQAEVRLGSSGSMVQRRPSTEADTLLRWLLAVAIQAYDR